MFKKYDVIVVGAGHAGCEAAAAAASMGSRVLLITMNMQTIGQMSCNPAMGGVAKGQIVREIDALGGLSGIVTDKSMIQFRMLNRSKGPAMWSPRTQNDRMLFAQEWRLALEKNPRIDFWQEMVSSLLIKEGKIYGVKTSMGLEIEANAVVLTNGTFLNGIIHIGEKQFGGGRTAEKASTGITEQLVSLGFESGRMKTGTPPRVDGRSLDYTKMDEQKGDEVPGKFSFSNTLPLTTQKSCFITYTNPKVHQILEKGFDQSPMFTGKIKGVGPRYCPSIEDKINRFAERDRHQLFIEPEGWDTVEIYVNGFSTSLPEHVQYEALKHISGFENVRLFRPGYAIEYDYFPPTQLHLSLETKLIKDLYFAGQINGTTGYEEAACQGLLAGINAHLQIHEQEPLILGRDQAYIGVLIDDLINKGTDEPYRMFTSRAEFRILLRQDNADLRLTELGHRIGLADATRLNVLDEKKKALKTVSEFLTDFKLYPDEVNRLLSAMESAELKEKVSLHNLLKRPELTIEKIKTIDSRINDTLSTYSTDILEQVEIQVKYASYIDKEYQLAEKMNHLEKIKIPKNINYTSMPALSNEAKEKLTKLKPETLGQASRISGISPADISVLLVYLHR